MVGLVIVIAAVIAILTIGFYVLKYIFKYARNMVDASFRKIGELLQLILDWMRWPLGIGFIIVSGCFALASIFLGSWVDISFIFWHINSITGAAIGVTVLLGIWLYPVLMVFMDRPVNKKWVGWAAVFAVLVAIAFMLYVRSKSGILIHTDPGFGVGIFLVACVFLFLGIALYKPKLISLSKTTTSILSGSLCPGDARFPRIRGRGLGFYYFCNDDRRMHVITHLYHAVGQAKFMLEPNLGLEGNYGLAPWAIREVEYLVRHHEKEIRDIWNKYTST